MSSVSTLTATQPIEMERPKVDIVAWLGLMPFVLFSLFFLIIPTGLLLAGAFFDKDGAFTFANIIGLSKPSIVASYVLSLQISAASALGGALIGAVLATSVVHGGLPTWLRPVLNTFCGVASNFAGLPLAFAFIATVGRLGVVTLLLKFVGLDLYGNGFTLFNFWGLTLTYLYFQIPLMVLILTPALDGLKKEWSEASAILGASVWQHWYYVSLPILWPSLLGSTLLLFANAFGAVATATALTGASLNIAPILLFAQIRGDVLHDPNLGYALALGMVLITGLSNVGYILLTSRTARWLR